MTISNARALVKEKKIMVDYFKRKDKTHSHKQRCRIAVKRAASFRAAMRINHFCDDSLARYSTI